MEAKDLNEARIYVGTYAKYNNGSLQGEWVELSDFYDLDGFMERCAEIYEDEEEPEFMFQAWEEIPDGLIDEGHLKENFFELRDELDRLNNREKEAFWRWVEGNNTQLTQDAYSLVKSFQSDYITRVRDNILKSKEQKNIQPTKGGHKMVTCQNYVSLFYRQITSCPSDGGIS